MSFQYEEVLLVLRTEWEGMRFGTWWIWFSHHCICSHMTRKWPDLLWLFGGHQISCQSAFKSSGAGLRSYLPVDSALCWKGMCRISMRGGMWAADMNWPDLSILSVITELPGGLSKDIFFFVKWVVFVLTLQQQNYFFMLNVPSLCLKTNYLDCVQTMYNW